MAGILLAASVKVSSAPSNGLITALSGAWELDESSGSNFTDSSGNGNTMTQVNTVGAGTGIVHANARDFETSSSQYGYIASNSSVTCGDIDFSIECWFKLESTGYYEIIAKDADPGTVTNGREYTLDIGYLYDGTPAQQLRFYFNGGGSSTNHVDSGVDMWGTVGSWNHAIAWHDATNNQLGIRVNNGSAVTTSTGGAVPQSGGAQLRIGARQYSGFEGYFDGLIGPARLWKQVLNTTQQDLLWGSGAGLPYSSFS